MRKYLRLVAFLFAAVGISTYITVSGAEKIERVDVVIIKESVQQNEPLGKNNLEIKKLPATGIPPGAIKEIPTGKVAGTDLYPGQYMLPHMANERPSDVLGPEHRTFPIPVALSNVGLISQGDTVDLFWFNESGASQLILSGVTVNSVLDSAGNKLVRQPETKIGEKMVPAVVELVVTVKQANMLNKAVNTGNFKLARYKPDSKPVDIREGKPIEDDPV